MPSEQQGLADSLAPIVAAVEIRSSERYRFAGRPGTEPNPQAQPVPGQVWPQTSLVYRLQMDLYQHCYSRPFRGRLAEPRSEPQQQADLLPALTAANATREGWDPGWWIEQLLPGGQVQARKADRVRTLWPGEFVSREAPGLPPAPGRPVSVYRPSGSAELQPGFYFAFSETLADSDGHQGFVRFYWNATAAGAVKLMQRLTDRLNRFQVPFRLKALTYSSQYDRTDPVILYVEKRHFQITALLALEAHRELADELGDEVGLFTRRLARGLGLAEDPGNGESFGMHRCRLVAEGLWQAFNRGLSDDAARLAEVIGRFQSEGLDVDRPHLGPGSVDLYRLPERPGVDGR